MRTGNAETVDRTTRVVGWMWQFAAWMLVLAGPGLLQAQETNAGPAAVVTMTDDLRFEPERVVVQAGDTVVWRNESKFVHSVTTAPDQAMRLANVDLPEGAQPFDSGEVYPGGSFRHTFTTPGFYRYFCNPHETAGMQGTVVVEPAR